MPNSRAEPLMPLLVSHSVPRSGEPHINGAYSTSLHVWVATGPDGDIPIILTRGAFGETSTSTATRAEHDDTDAESGAMAGTSTFTKVTTEGDDTDASCGALLEVTTKTMAQLERDDTQINDDFLNPPLASCGQSGILRLQ